MAAISVNITNVGLTIRRRAAPVQYLEVVRLAQHTVLVQGELFACAELPFTRVAGEAGQVVDVVPGLAHPVACRDASTALGTLGAETSASKQIVFSRIYSFLFLSTKIYPVVFALSKYTVYRPLLCCLYRALFYNCYNAKPPKCTPDKLIFLFVYIITYFTNYHTTNKCTNCMSFILNHFFKTLSLLLHVSIAYRLSSSGSTYSS